MQKITKFALSLVMVFVALAVNAKTVEVDLTAQGYENNQAVTAVTVDGVTLTFDKGTNQNAPKYYTTGNAVRVYGGGTMTVTAGGKTITGIELTFGSGDGSNDLTANVGTFESPVWTGSENEVVFTVGGTSGHRRIAKVNVTYNDAAAAGWDGTVTSSLDNVTMKSVSEFEGITLKFNGANSIVVNSVEDDGETLYGTFEAWNPDFTQYYIWSPYYGSTYVINGDEITLNGWINQSGDFKPKKTLGKRQVIKHAAEGETDYQFEMMDYGETFVIDGEVYEEQIDLFFNATKDEPAQPFAITVSNYRVEGANGGRQEASEYGLSTGFQIGAEPALAAGTAVPTLSFNSADQGEATINAYGFAGAGGSIQFNAAPASEQGMFSAPGEYTLIVPEGTFVDAEGTPSAAFSSTWVIIEKETNPFDITAVTMNWKGEEIAAGSEVEALSYAYNVVTDKEGLVAGEGHIEFKNAEGAGIGVGSWNGYYLSFTNFGQDGYTTPGTYTLTIPAGALVDAEGNPCNEFTATWTVVAPETQTINIETVEVGTVDKQFGEVTDTYYTATVKFQKPEGAAYAYVEGMQVSLNGETSNVMFMAPDYGFVELGAEDEVTLVFTDGMKAATNDPEFDGDLRPAGSYVATAEIYFMDAYQAELPVVAKYTGSIVLPNLNAVELGTPEFNVAVAAEAGEKITEGWVEANGIVMTLVDAKNITPDMQIKVVADLMATVPGYGAPDGEDGNFNAPQYQTVIENAEFTGDAMFGAATVAMSEFDQYVVEAGAGNAFQIIVKSIEVIGATGVEASWVMDEESELVGCAFEVVEAEPAAPSFGGVAFNIEEGAEITVDDVHNLAIKMYFPDGTGFEGYAFAGDVMLVKQNAEGEWDYANPVGFAELYSEYAEDMLDAEFAPALFAEALQDAVVGETYRVLAIDYALLDADNQPVTFESYENPATAPYVTFEVVDVASGINTVKFNVTDVKYNLAGQRVNNAKGIVIMNGKKFINK